MYSDLRQLFWSPFIASVIEFSIDELSLKFLSVLGNFSTFRHIILINWCDRNIECKLCRMSKPDSFFDFTSLTDGSATNCHAKSAYNVKMQKRATKAHGFWWLNFFPCSFSTKRSSVLTFLFDPPLIRRFSLFVMDFNIFTCHESFSASTKVFSSAFWMQ